jgi:opacity protein-like surface antigen
MKHYNQVLYAQVLALSFGPFGLSVTPVQAGGLLAPPEPVSSWTGFSIGLGGGFESLDANVRTNASRTDSVTLCDLTACDSMRIDVLDFTQSYNSKKSSISDQGSFFTVQGAYDYQFAPRWLAGAFVDADWSNVSAHSKESSTSTLTLFPNGTEPLFSNPGIFPLNIPLGNASIDTRMSTNWTISAGGRIGWLANADTLLYVLGAYTHADLNDARVKVNIGDPLAFVDSLGVLPTSINSPTSLLVRLPTSLDGYSLGGGGEVKLGGPWTAKLEYRWTHLDGGTRHVAGSNSQSVNLGDIFGPDSNPGVIRNIQSNASANFDANIQSVRAEISYHFWTGGHG